MLFHDLWKVLKIQISVPINKMELECTCPFLYILSVAAFELQRQSWIVATRRVWPMKPEILIIWSFREKVCWPLDYTLLFCPSTAISFKLSAALASWLYWLYPREFCKIWVCTITSRCGGCTLWHRYGNNAPCECVLIGDGPQLPTRSWNNYFPQSALSPSSVQMHVLFAKS